MSESKKISSHASNDLGSKRPSYIKIRDESPVLRDCKITMTRIYRSALGTVQIQLPTFTEHEGRRSYLVIPLLPRECENFSNMEINDRGKNLPRIPASLTRATDGTCQNFANDNIRGVQQVVKIPVKV